MAEFVERANGAEATDPSAVGHQHRVADIAVAIATDLGLDAEAVESIRVAALLHDIGKTPIPTDAPNHRGAVSLSEWEMIKTHCQVGYEIVAGSLIESHVAEMVLQHHERCDGSGFPAGLRGDEISLGARILAVADTVEDEMSHPPEGVDGALDHALATIRRGRDSLFDRNVVTACLRLDQERRLLLGGEVVPGA